MPPEPPTTGLPPPDPCSLRPLASTEFVEPPAPAKFLVVPPLPQVTFFFLAFVNAHIDVQHCNLFSSAVLLHQINTIQCPNTVKLLFYNYDTQVILMFRKYDVKHERQQFILIQGDQKVSVHLTITAQSSGVQKLFDHSVLM